MTEIYRGNHQIVLGNIKFPIFFFFWLGGGGGVAGAARKRKLGGFNFCLENCYAKVKSWLKTENR